MYVVPLLAGQSSRGVYVGVGATKVVWAAVEVMVDVGAEDDEEDLFGRVSR